MSEALRLTAAEQVSTWCGSALSALRVNETGIDIVATCTSPLAQIITASVVVLALVVGALQASRLAQMLHRRGLAALAVTLLWSAQPAYAISREHHCARTRTLDHVLIRRGPPQGC